MIDEKTWYESKTIWGALLAIAASSAGVFGITIGIDAQGQIADALIEIIGAFGALLAIYGRLSATDMIK